MSITDNLENRLNLDNDSDVYGTYEESDKGLRHMQMRLKARGGTDQWTRMRDDKLRSLMKALLYSYQSAIVQKYDVATETLIGKIVEIINKLENEEELTETDEVIIESLKEDYPDISDDTLVEDLRNICDSLESSEPQFRCLINHDKLKVDYEDKIISIPFEEPPVGLDDPIETGFTNGTVFKWVHGNKEEWTPDSYWIVYMQYSEETAYFRAEIRKADEEISVVVVNEDGEEETYTYRGWMTGPNETTAMWNIKKGVVWNDLNYTKLLYITKDEYTTAFFKRFDRLIVNGEPWEVQAYNDSYGNSSSKSDSGIIRVALKETYTSTDKFIEESLDAAAQAEEVQAQEDAARTDARIDGPTEVKPFDIITYTAKNFDTVEEWSLSTSTLAKIKKVSDDGNTITIEVLTGYSSAVGFDVNYGENTIHVDIGSL